MSKLGFGKKSVEADYIAFFISVAAFIAAAVLVLYYMHRMDVESGFSYLSGTGVEQDPFIIASTEDYIYFVDQFNDNGQDYRDVYVVLDSNIALGEAYSGYCIGNTDKSIYFNGVFDGRGHYIAGLNIQNDRAALFPKLSGTVRNLMIKDSYFEGKNAGGIAGFVETYGQIVNCCSMAQVTGENAGGICSVNEGTIENCICYDNAAPVSKQQEMGCMVNVYSCDALANAAAVDELNANILKLMPEGEFNKWSEDCGQAVLTEAMMPMAVSVSAKIIAAGRDTQLQAFFSEPERRWILPIPEGCAGDEYEVTAVSGNGETFTQTISSKGGSIDIDGTAIAVEACTYSDVPTVFMSFYGEDSLSYLSRSKELEVTGDMLVLHPDGRKDISSAGVVFSGRGNDSFLAEKKGYSIKLPLEMSIAGMEETYEYNLLSGYRDNCFLTYMFTRDYYRELQLPYTHDYRAVNLFVNGQFRGLYFLTEKMNISKSTFDLDNLYENTKRYNDNYLYMYPCLSDLNEEGSGKIVYYGLRGEPEDKTGGYLLEIAMEDYSETQSYFTTNSGVIIKSRGDKYLSRNQLDYIRSLWQDFEDAVRSEDGYNQKGVYYADYIDLTSFADQWIIFEMAADLANENSVYYYKDSDRAGDGRIHAVWMWDVEHAFVDRDRINQHFLMRRVENGKKGNFWTWFYSHEDFRAAVADEWSSRFRPVNAKVPGWWKDYRDSYTESYMLNDLRWKNTDYLKKCDELEDYFSLRTNFLDGYFVTK